jgi:2-polyprenyl-6-methoxyphenol hydroxylase-like FAD-dependent oxidoreductase
VEFAANKNDVEGQFLRMFELAPSFADIVRGARRETRFAGMATPNFFRKPFGPGWALIGDAGYLKDPITAQGILDAFRDAERCALAADEALSGKRPFDAAMADYQRDRDGQVKAMYDFTCDIAKLEPPSDELQQLLMAIHGNQEAMDQFMQVNAGTTSPAVFFAPENVGAIMAARR